MTGECALSIALCTIMVVGHTAKGLLGSAANDVVSGAWQSVCQSFADAATAMLKAFASAFAAIPTVNLASAGVRSIYGISMGIAAAVAALLLIGQVIRTAFTHDGTALATALTGIAKAALAFLLTLAVATAALAAADEVTHWIITASFGSAGALSSRLGDVLGGAAASNPAAGGGVSAALLLVFGVLGILLVVVLWFELLLRNAAIAVLIATSPIAAAGQMSESTRTWWTRLVSATIQLIILKPVIALVFAIGLGMTGKASDIETLLAGMLVLVLAAFAWPAIARFFAFATVQVAGGSGLGTLLGFAAGRAAGGGGGAPAGIEPGEFSRQMERRTMAGMESAPALAGTAAGGLGLAGAAAGAGGASCRAGSAGGDGPAGASGQGGALAKGGGLPAAGALAVAGAQVAQRAVNSLTGHMEQMAGHAGIQGANPYAQPAGTPRFRGGGQSSPASQARPETDGPGHDAGDSQSAPERRDTERPDLQGPDPAPTPRDTRMREAEPPASFEGGD